jgi:predicted nucleic acid-binding protein
VPDVLVDTDVLVDHLRGARAFERRGARVSYSIVTRVELFAGRASQEETVATLLAPFRELAIDRAIAERAGRLRRELGVGLPAALIAATALEHGLALATRNLRDFQHVPKLRLVRATR